MGQTTVLLLAAVLWPLLAVFSGWAFRLPRRERVRSLCVLGAGAVAGMALVVLFASPALARGESAPAASLLFSRREMWPQFAVAAPLGALIALLLIQTTETTQETTH